MIDRASRDGTIVVLLVDAWLALLGVYAEVLAEFDRRNELTVAVLIVRNQQDDVTLHAGGVLDVAVSRAFPNNIMRRDAIFRVAVGSSEQLYQNLQLVLEVAVNRMLRRGHVFRVPPVEGSAGAQIAVTGTDHE